MDLAPVNNLDDIHHASVVKTLIAAHKDRHIGICRDHRLERFFKVNESRGFVVEENVVRRIHRNRISLVVLRWKRICLGLWQHDGNALFEGGQGHDESNEQEEGEVNERRHINGRFWLFAPHATTSGHVSQPFPGIHTQCAREARPQSLPCRTSSYEFAHLSN